jgi:DNA recombination protein RmuC
MTKNVIDIATMGGNMYDKFVGFVEDMQRIDKALSSTKDAYDKAMNKLSTGRGNLVGRAEKLRKMGAKATKALPSQFTQSETDDTDDSDDTDE